MFACFDTAENEPCKVCPLSAYRSPRFRMKTGTKIRYNMKRRNWRKTKLHYN